MQLHKYFISYWIEQQCFGWKLFDVKDMDDLTIKNLNKFPKMNLSVTVLIITHTSD